MKAFEEITSPTEIKCLVAFCDLARFNKSIQNLPLAEVFASLNKLYELCGEIIEEQGGKIVKFIGDGVLIAFPEHLASQGVQTLITLKEKTDWLLKKLKIGSHMFVKINFGTVMAGPIGTRNEKHFDLFGKTVNDTALLKSYTMAMTPQAFRCLDPEVRKLFKKHTPPITYISLEEPHRD